MGFAVKCEIKNGKPLVEIAKYSSKSKLSPFTINPVAKKNSKKNMKFEDISGKFSGKYSPDEFTLVPNELARDSGFDAEFVFIPKKLERSVIQLLLEKENSIGIEYYYYYYEEVLRTQYKDFKLSKRERRILNGKRSFYIEGSSQSEKERYSMYIFMVELGNGEFLIVLGSSPEEFSKQFHLLYKKFVKHIKF